MLTSSLRAVKTFSLASTSSGGNAISLSARSSSRISRTDSIGVVYPIYSAFALPISGSHMKLMNISAASWCSLVAGMHMLSTDSTLPSSGKTQARSGLSSIMVMASPE